jgi:bifunctional non-homologous end joining protein LigD
MAAAGRFPGFVEPCLPELWERSPDSEHWVHEIKHDGYRLQIHVSDSGIQAFTRRGNDWSERFTRIRCGRSSLKASYRSAGMRSMPPAALTHG